MPAEGSKGVVDEGEVEAAEVWEVVWEAVWEAVWEVVPQGRWAEAPRRDLLLAQAPPILAEAVHRRVRISIHRM